MRYPVPGTTGTGTWYRVLMGMAQNHYMKLIIGDEMFIYKGPMTKMT